MNRVIIDGENLTLEDLINVARNNYEVVISDTVIDKVVKSRKYVDDIVENNRVVYGITTAFGKLSDVVISKEDTKALQRNLIISHACGVGEPFEIDVVRAMMLLRANNLIKGYSGIRLTTVQTLVEMINKKVHPKVPKKGSLGASGDLAPLSHMVLPLIGEGEAYYNGELLDGNTAMELAGIIPVELAEKEGLALINGTQAMTAQGAIVTYDAINLCKLSDIASSLTSEALEGVIDAYNPKLHIIRPHSGQIATAKNLLTILDGSQRVTRQGQIRTQDAYSLRCAPQVHGASKDAINYVLDKLNIEMNAVTDNPIILADDDMAISGGNFHGQPMALAFDFLGIAVAELANISERRIERLVNPQLSGLPPFLAFDGGLNSGFMIAQYSAASLVSENKVLAHPSSVDSIPSSGNQEDHVSMGTIGAVKASTILYNAQRVLAIELLASAQAIDMKNEDKELGKGTKVAYDTIRKITDTIKTDVVMYKEINKVCNIVEDNSIVNKVEEAIGKLDV